MNTLPNIALVGNAPKEKHALLNAMLAEEDLADICNITLYGAKGEPESEALQNAVNDYERGQVQGLVCLPMREHLHKILKHTKGIDISNMLLVTMTGQSVTASVKGYGSIEHIAESLTAENIKDAVTRLNLCLKRDINIQNPRIALLALNDTIETNQESAEVSIIAPAVSELVKSGIQVFGPQPVTTLGEQTTWTAYDAVLRMYAQQGEANGIATDEKAVTLATGINIPLTSAKPEGILAAIFTVIDVIRNRKEYDAPFANPLEKLYHERKENGDKARFAVKKKGFNPAEHRRENVTYITKNTQEGE